MPCDEFKTLSRNYPSVETSMSRKGNYWDNAIAESLFKTLKRNGYHQKYLTVQQAALSIFQDIETWYNKRKRNSTLGYRSPKQFE